MPTHITVNGLGLTYKTATGISAATIPDVCKTPTPGGPVPIPYPNFAQQSSLDNGTTTVFAKGKMIAVKGSHYSRSNGDEAGTVGGVKSNVNMKATDWITYSFDVKMDGKNACRHTDKKFHNNKNAVDLAGNIEFLTPAQAKGLLCAIYCECQAEAQARKFEDLTDPASFDQPDFGADPNRSPGKAMFQACVARKIRREYKNTNLIPEQSYDMSKKPPMPVPGMPRGTKRPDVVLLKGPGIPRAPNIVVYEMKFGRDTYPDSQRRAYRRIGGGNRAIVLTAKRCGCSK